MANKIIVNSHIYFSGRKGRIFFPTIVSMVVEIDYDAQK